ncbi:hypothetical protein SLE2022_288920 [Rubroshorea leprosula]
MVEENSLARPSLNIKQQISCPSTPEQNGVAERKHRHIVETGLTMLINNLPPRYWVDTFSTVVFLSNRMPLSALNNGSPYYMLYDKTTDYPMIKVFGCRCFRYLRDYAAHKLQPRSLNQIRTLSLVDLLGFLRLDSPIFENLSI